MKVYEGVGRGGRETDEGGGSGEVEGESQKVLYVNRMHGTYIRWWEGVVVETPT